MARTKLQQTGFTIVELMIATLVFTMVLLICAYAIIHVGKMYYKGVITGRTQDTSRAIIEDVTQAIQFGSGPKDPSIFRKRTTAVLTPGNIPIEAYCLGSVRYTFSRQLSQGLATNQLRHILWRDETTDPNCPPVDLRNNLTNGEELVGENMRVPEFSVNESSGVWNINLRVAYGDDPTLFEGNNEFRFCKGSTAGGQFCATSEFTTSVTRRL